MLRIFFWNWTLSLDIQPEQVFRPIGVLNRSRKLQHSKVIINPFSSHYGFSPRRRRHCISTSSRLAINTPVLFPNKWYQNPQFTLLNLPAKWDIEETRSFDLGLPEYSGLQLETSTSKLFFFFSEGQFSLRDALPYLVVFIISNCMDNSFWSTMIPCKLVL